MTEVIELFETNQIEIPDCKTDFARDIEDDDVRHNLGTAVRARVRA